MTTVAGFDHLYQTVDDRTRQLLDRRRRNPIIRSRGWVVRRLLVSADVVGLVVAFVVAQVAFGADPRHDLVGPGLETIVFVLTLPVWIVAAQIYGLYERDEERTNHTTAEDVVGVFHLLTVGSWILFAFVSVAGIGHPTMARQLTFWLTGIAAVAAARVGARTISRRSVAYLQNTVIVGAGDVGQLVARKLLQHSEYGLNLVGFVDADPRVRRQDLGHLTVLGTPEDLPSVVDLLDVERVIIAFSHDSADELVKLVRVLRKTDVQIDVVPRLFDVIGPGVDVHDVEGMPLLSLRPARPRRSSRLAKRCIDILGASVVLAVCAPLMLWIAWRIRRDSEGPVFFRQTRLGYDQREFTLLKFRTMAADTDPGVHADYIKRLAQGTTSQEDGGLFKLERHDVITKVGASLRRRSLDELPQLINVVRGEMSLVGPRPCIPYETEFFEAHHFERFNVPAGLTGLWQVTARAKATMSEALDMDVAYARSWSNGLDLRLLLRTPLQLLRSGETR